jgi:hypothetical protein
VGELPGKPSDHHEGVFDFMADFGHNLAQGCETFGLDDTFLKGFNLGEVSNNACKVSLSVCHGNGEGDARRKRFAALPGCQDFCIVPDPPGYLGADISRDGLPVIFAAGGRHDPVKIVPDHLVPIVTKDPFRSLVEEDDPVAAVDGDKCLIGIFNRRLENRPAPACVGLVSHGFFPVFLYPDFI